MIAGAARAMSTKGQQFAPGPDSSALHLASPKDGVDRELASVDAQGDLWIQRFRLVPEFRLADARHLGIQSLAAAVFWLLESCRERERFLRLGTASVNCSPPSSTD